MGLFNLGGSKGPNLAKLKGLIQKEYNGITFTEKSRTNDKVEIHLDAEVVNKIERSVLTPVSTSSKARVPVLGTNNAIYWEDVESFGGGSTIYRHTVQLTKESGAHGTPPPSIAQFILYSSKPTALTFNELAAVMVGMPIVFTDTGSSIYSGSAGGVCSFVDSFGDYIEFYVNGTTLYGDEISDSIDPA